MAGSLTRTNSTTLATRTPNNDAERFRDLCVQRGISTSEGLRLLMAAEGDDVDTGAEAPASSTVAALKGAVEALRQNDEEAALQILAELLDKLADAAESPKAPTPNRQPPTPKISTREAVAKLSASTLSEIKKRGWTPEQFVTKRDAATRRYSR